MILAGDIGGTTTRLGWFKGENDFRPLALETFESHAFDGLEAIVAAFLARHPRRVDAAAFGVAGTVAGESASLPNIAWSVELSSLRKVLGVETIGLINDLQANAYGIACLNADEFLLLQEGERREGNAVLISAGTGLGQSILVWDGRMHRPSPSEGGHCDFAPRNEWEVSFWRFLGKRYPGHVSYERVLSGRGLVDLFDFIVSTGVKPAADSVEARRLNADCAPQISAAGLDRSCAASSEAVDRFLEIYGAEAGNLALKGLAVHGVYIGGGIAPKLRSRIGQGGFIDTFRSKGRFRPLMESMRVEVILNEKTALYGAARYAVMCIGAD